MANIQRIRCALGFGGRLPWFVIYNPIFWFHVYGIKKISTWNFFKWKQNVSSQICICCNSSKFWALRVLINSFFLSVLGFCKGIRKWHPQVLGGLHDPRPVAVVRGEGGGDDGKMWYPPHPSPCSMPDAGRTPFLFFLIVRPWSMSSILQINTLS